MSEREYAKSIIDILPEEAIGDVIGFMMNISDESYDEEKFVLVARYILDKYHRAFEELA